MRNYARKTIKPGMRMIDIANMIEDGTRALVEENGMESGVGFPTGLSLNNCAAHYSPNSGDTIGRPTVPAFETLNHLSISVLQQGDVMKVDFGVQVKGRILDSAFTMAFDHTYDKLLEAVKAATDTGIRVRCMCYDDDVAVLTALCCTGGRYRCTTWRACRLHTRDNGVVRS